MYKITEMTTVSFIVIFYNLQGGFKILMYNITLNELETIFTLDYNSYNSLAKLEKLIPRHKLTILEKGETLIYQKDPINYFYFLLNGRLSAVNQITWNTDNVIDYLEPLDMVGLIEYLNHINFYTAYVVADTKSIVYKIRKDVFEQMLQTNTSLCYKTLFLLGKIAGSNMHRAEARRLFHPLDMLGHYLFLESRAHLPYVCPITRSMLAEKLHINLRSLYRYLDTLNTMNYIEIKHGKICINSDNFEKLESRYGNVIL